MKTAIVLRGSSKRKTSHEKPAYYKEMYVYWQQKAWADTQISVEWFNKTINDATRKSDN